MIKLFTSGNCPNCENVKKFFTDRGEEFKTFNVEKHPKYASEMSGVSVPEVIHDSIHIIGEKAIKTHFLAIK